MNGADHSYFCSDSLNKHNNGLGNVNNGSTALPIVFPIKMSTIALAPDKAKENTDIFFKNIDILKNILENSLTFCYADML